MDQGAAGKALTNTRLPMPVSSALRARAVKPTLICGLRGPQLRTRTEEKGSIANRAKSVKCNARPV